MRTHFGFHCYPKECFLGWCIRTEVDRRKRENSHSLANSTFSLFNKPSNLSSLLSHKEICSSSTSTQFIIMIITLEDITKEEKIMEKTFSIITLFHQVFVFANLLILCTIIATILSYSLEWLFDTKISILLLFGLLMILNGAILLTLHLVPSFAAISLHYPQFIDFGSLYVARKEANVCLSALRFVTDVDHRRATVAEDDPYRNIYTSTLEAGMFGSSTVIIWFGANMDNTSSAAASWIDQLAICVAQPHFIGTARLSVRTDRGFDVYARLHCTNSWGGMAQWIAKRQLGNSTREELAPSDTTPLL